MERIKKFNKKVIIFVRKNPLLSLIVLALVVLIVNIFIAVVTRTNIREINQSAQDVVDTSKSQGENLKPSDFPENEDLLQQLPEINEYFSANYLPLSEEIKISVELYKDESQEKFDQWIENFDNTSEIEFIFASNPDGLAQSFDSRKAKYGELLQLIPYDNELFSVRAEDSDLIGIKFRIFYDDTNPGNLNTVFEFLNRYHLYAETLNIIEISPFKQPLDGIGD